MSENQPSSGSRWEPAPADAPQHHHEQATDLIDRPLAPPPRPARRRRLAAAVAGIGLFLAGGAGGYALGHATAGSAAPTVREHRGGGPGGFRGGVDDNGGAPGVGTGTGATGPST